MNLDEFLAYTKEVDEKAYKILGQANQEYAKSENKFDNFDTIAQLFINVCPEFEGILKPKHVAIIYFLKHFISIMKGVSIREDMSGRYIDAANYIRLMMGLDERERRSGMIDKPDSNSSTLILKEVWVGPSEKGFD